MLCIDGKFMRFLSEDKFILTIERSLVEIPIVGNFL